MSTFSAAVKVLARVAMPVALMLSAASAQTFSSIDYPGATLTIAYGVNRSGEIVGTYNDVSNVTHGFLLSGGTFTTVDYPGATLSVCAGINDASLIAGQFNDSAGRGHGFVWRGGVFYRLPDNGKVYNTSPVSISNKHQLVGFTISSPNANGVFSGFEFASKVYTPVNFPGANFTVALGINPRGTNIVGAYSLTFPTGTGYGFRNVGGTFTTIAVPGSTGTQAFGINDAGHIVGNYYVSGSSNSHGFLQTTAGFRNIDYPGATQTDPSNLNDLDEVVGWYVDATGVTHGYSMTK